MIEEKDFQALLAAARLPPEGHESKAPWPSLLRHYLSLNPALKMQTRILKILLMFEYI